MGSVVGERITRTIEYGTAEHCSVIIVAASGELACTKDVELDANGQNKRRTRSP